jgi:hypothetical protein
MRLAVAQIAAEYLKKEEAFLELSHGGGVLRPISIMHSGFSSRFERLAACSTNVKFKSPRVQICGFRSRLAFELDSSTFIRIADNSFRRWVQELRCIICDDLGRNAPQKIDYAFLSTIAWTGDALADSEERKVLQSS